jgi:hypothetical protein
MPEREVKRTLVSYLDEEGIRRYGLAGEHVSLHADDLERFDKANGGAPDSPPDPAPKRRPRQPK